MVDLGIALPPGHRLVSVAEQPDLASVGRLWPVFAEFMHHDEVVDRIWPRLFSDWPEHQLVLLATDHSPVAFANSAPLLWDGTDEGLPDGWDEQAERSLDDLDAAPAPNTLGALLIVVDPARQGGQLSGAMLQAMRANARSHGLGAFIACVRPTLKQRYPLQSIEAYAAWTREDGLPFDPWIRLHARLGGRIVRASPSSMTMHGSVADWQEWSGIAFPESGDCVVDGGTSPVHIDRERDEGIYYDQNIWMVHEL
jgi:GNAT superfamily N-acetyltransferase